MADPVDDGKVWMGIPDRVLYLIFLALFTAISTTINGYFSNRTKTAVDAHAAVQVEHQEEIKTQQEEVKTAVAAVKEVVQEKAADIKKSVQKVPEATATAIQARATELRSVIVQKAVSDFLFGCAFGMGFSIAAAVCQLIAMLFSKAGH